MAVRVRYRPNELGEGAIDVFPEANCWEEREDGGLVLFEKWEDDDGKKRKHRIGLIPHGRWESVIVQEDAEAE